jgi:putative CRISPR-associated protein (TIGR02619 family)
MTRCRARVCSPRFRGTREERDEERARRELWVSALSAVLRERTAVPGLEGFTSNKVDDLVRYLRDNGGARASVEAAVVDKPEWFAELTAMRSYIERREVDLAYLVSTRTQASRMCVDWLARYLRDRAGVLVETGPQFEGYDPATDADARAAAFAADLQVLRARTLRYVKRRQESGDRVFIAAQGGYKPEAGVMMIVGAETGATVYYAHEEMRRSVELPVLAYHGPMEALRALKGAGGRVTRLDAAPLFARHPDLAEAERAYAIEVRRDEGGVVVEMKLTDYGKLLVEDA